MPAVAGTTRSTRSCSTRTSGMRPGELPCGQLCRAGPGVQRAEHRRRAYHTAPWHWQPRPLSSRRPTVPLQCCQQLSRGLGAVRGNPVAFAAGAAAQRSSRWHSCTVRAGPACTLHLAAAPAPASSARPGLPCFCPLPPPPPDPPLRAAAGCTTASLAPRRSPSSSPPLRRSA
jgi:hypothetical protein